MNQINKIKQTVPKITNYSFKKKINYPKVGVLNPPSYIKSIDDDIKIAENKKLKKYTGKNSNYYQGLLSVLIIAISAIAILLAKYIKK